MNDGLKQDFRYSINPALITVLFFSFLAIAVVLFNINKIDFREANIFTLLWTWLLLLIIHILVNLKRFVHLIRQKRQDVIWKSFLQLSYLYAPYFIIAFLYDNLNLIQQVSSNSFPVIDPQLKAIDEFLFGGQPSLYLEKWLNPFAVDYFMVAYSLYFIYPYFYLIYLIQKNQLDLFQKVLLAQNLAIALSLLSFIFFPAKGPRVLLSADYSMELTGISFDFLKDFYGKPSFFHLQRDLWNYLERVKTDCMPSMHAGLCLLVLFYAIRYSDLFKHKKSAMYFWITGVISLVISTFYLRYHWIIDVIAGIIFAIIIYYLVEIIFRYWQTRFIKYNFKDSKIPWL